MENWLSMLDVQTEGCCDTVGWSGIIVQILYRFLTLIFRVIGMFADLLHIAFYIFAGVDVNSVYDPTKPNVYDITVNNTRKNILDYFLFSESMTKAYFWLAAIGLLLIVVFTIYKIIKQDYFEKAGPRSKGPIFRNVAISCISFLLVVPIFYLIIHVSSLLAVAVMSAMGMNINKFAGAQIFELSWSDGGTSFILINDALAGTGLDGLTWMKELHNDSWFTLAAKGEYVTKDPIIMKALGDSEGVSVGKWTGPLPIVFNPDTQQLEAVEFYWYIYLVGVVVAIKALYKMMLAMLQRIFMLMGLFLVAPSPISQYVLDDGAKFRDWLKKSIHQGLRLVVATMSFSIYLIALGLIGNIEFYQAFEGAVSQGGSAEKLNVSADLLVYTGEPMRASASTMLASSSGGFFGSLVNAFLRIFMLMGAGGAITDLDGLLTPLITGERDSLNAGATGAAADKVASTAKGAVTGLAKLGVSAAVGGVAGMIGGMRGHTNTIGAEGAGEAAGEAAEEANAEKIKNEVNKSEGGNGPTGGNGPAGETSTASEAPKDENPEAPKDENPEAPKDENPEAPKDENPEAPKDENPEAPKDENPEAPKDENPEAPKDENPEAPKDENPEAPKDENPEAPKDENTEEPKDSAGNTGTTQKADATPMENKQTTKLSSKFGRFMRGAGRLGVNMLAGTALGIFKPIGKAAWGLTKKALSKVGIDTSAVAQTYCSARNNARDLGMKSYEKHKNKAYNTRREDRLNNAAVATEQKGNEVNNQIDNLDKAVKNEDAAAGDLRRAQGTANNANVAAEDANADVENNVASDIDSNFSAETRERAKLVSENEKLGSKEDLQKRIEENEIKINSGNITGKQKKDLKLENKHYQESIKTIDSNNNRIAEIDNGRNKINDTAKVMSDVNGELTKLGITKENPSFEEVKEAVERRGSDELKKAFASDNAKAIYENERVVTARRANSDARSANESLGAAQTKYDNAHKNTQKQQELLETKVNEYTKSANLVETYSHSFDESKERSEFNKYANYDSSKHAFGKKPKAQLGETGGKKRRGRAQGTNQNIQAEKGTFVDFAEDSLNRAKNAEIVRNDSVTLTTGVINAAQTARANTKEAEGKLHDYVKQHENLQITTSSGATTLGEYVGKSTNIGAKLESLYKNIPNGERDRVFTPELQGLRKDYNVARNNQTRATSAATSALSTVNVMRSVTDKNVQRLEDIRGEYMETTGKAKTIEKIIANPGKATKEDIKVIEKEAGKIDYSKYTNPETGYIDKNRAIADKAKEARKSNVNHQSELLKEADGLRKKNDADTTKLQSIIDKLATAGGYKTPETGTKPNGQTVINNTTNNNMNGGGNNNQNVSLEGLASQLQGMVNNNANAPTNPNGIATESSQAVYERMQAEGIRRLETMLEQVKAENRHILGDVEEIKTKVNRPKDDK